MYIFQSSILFPDFSIVEKVQFMYLFTYVPLLFEFHFIGRSSTISLIPFIIISPYQVSISSLCHFRFFFRLFHLSVVPFVYVSNATFFCTVSFLNYLFESVQFWDPLFSPSMVLCWDYFFFVLLFLSFLPLSILFWFNLQSYEFTLVENSFG